MTLSIIFKAVCAGLLFGAASQSMQESVGYTHEQSIDRLILATAVICLCSVLFWVLHAFDVFDTSAALQSGGFFSMAVIVLLSFSCGALARAYDVSKTALGNDSPLILATQLSFSALALTAFVSAMFSHPTTDTAQSDPKSWWFVPFQLLFGGGTPCLPLFAIVIGEINSTESTPYALAIVSTVAGFASLVLFAVYFSMKKSGNASKEAMVLLLWFAILIDITSAGSAGLACGYLFQMGQYANAGDSNVAVWLLASTTVAKLVQWVVSHAYESEPKLKNY